MFSQSLSALPETAPELAAATIDSSAALVLCGVLLDVLAQMPQARALMQEAAERYELSSLEGDPTAKAATLMAVGRLIGACEAKAA